MRAFFTAHGPAFKPGSVLEPFENVDIVPLICQITGLPQPDTNGSALSFQNALVSSSGTNGASTSSRSLHGRTDLNLTIIIIMMFMVNVMCGNHPNCPHRLIISL
jgi:hypothetical protein